MAWLDTHSRLTVFKTALACAALSVSVFVTFAPAAMAQGGLGAIKSGLDTAGQQSGLKTSTNVSLETMVGRIINSAMGLLGVLLLGYMLYGGFLWMTSGGDTKGADKAKSTITNAVIGILIIALAYVLTDFILRALIQAQTGTSGP